MWPVLYTVARQISVAVRLGHDLPAVYLHALDYISFLGPANLETKIVQSALQPRCSRIIEVDAFLSDLDGRWRQTFARSQCRTYPQCAALQINLHAKCQKAELKAAVLAIGVACKVMNALFYDRANAISGSRLWPSAACKASM